MNWLKNIKISSTLPELVSILNSIFNIPRFLNYEVNKYKTDPAKQNLLKQLLNDSNLLAKELQRKNFELGLFRQGNESLTISKAPELFTSLLPRIQQFLNKVEIFNDPKLNEKFQQVIMGISELGISSTEIPPITPEIKKQVTPKISKNWVAAKVIGFSKDKNLELDDIIALSKNPDNSWDYIVLQNQDHGYTPEITGKFSPQENLQAIISSLKDKNGKPIVSNNIESLKSLLEQFFSRKKETPKENITEENITQEEVTKETEEKTWYKGIVKENIDLENTYGLEPKEAVAVNKTEEGWNFIVLNDNGKTNGTIPENEVNTFLEIDKANTANSPDNWIHEEMSKEFEEQRKKGEKHLIKTMTEEQKAIENKFAKNSEEKEPSHIMVNALAGTGKTSTIKHLAWKYGKPGENWLYLVFNKKNQIEGKEKFPPWVHVKTTNAFLGEVLQKHNSMELPYTERMVGISKSAKGDKKENIPEKTRILADGPDFLKLMLNSLNFNLKAIDSVDFKLKKTIDSLIRSVFYNYKESTIQLTNLAKSFAVDPRDEKTVAKKLSDIADKYDIDFQLSQVKERITKYKDSQWKAALLTGLAKIMGSNFMGREFKKEIMNQSIWLLKQALPGGTNMVYSHTYQDGKTKSFKLSEYRDFNDDLWYTAINSDKIQWEKYDYVLADEVQDFNLCQKEMLKKLGEAGAKIVAIGDPNQSIYRFRGSDPNIFFSLEKQLQETSKDKNVLLPITTNFRCRPNIIKFVNENTIVNNLKGRVFPDGNDGVVTREEIEYDNIFTILKSEQEKEGKTKETAFISRTNEPLVHAALKMLNMGIPFAIVGKDIADDLRKHIGKIMKMTGLDDINPVQSLEYSLNDFLGKENEAWHGKSAKKAYLQELIDTTKALQSCIEQFQNELANKQQTEGNYSNDNIRSFNNWLKQRLGGFNIEENEADLKAYKEKLEKESPVILTTVHRSKGLEFGRVCILRDDQFPHPKAKLPDDLKEEANVKYVGYTRSKDELHILKLEGQPGYKSGKSGNNWYNKIKYW